MPTNNDIYEALREGRWRPEINVVETDKGYEATYVQGDQVIKKFSKWNAQQAETDVLEEIFDGVIEGKYFPQ
jgi:hypothetical protein